MKRREFIAGLGSAAAWPMAARAQQSAMPVIGYLHAGSAAQGPQFEAAFRKGLSETGYTEGRNVAIEYRWAEQQANRLPELAADLVRRRVTVIAALGSSALAAKAATTTIPIVYGSGVDPVQAGLVASLNRPGGNVTGIGYMNAELMPKRLGLLHELLPAATRFAVLVNPNGPSAESTIKSLQAAASAIGVQIEVFNISSNRDIDTVFASVVQKRAEGVLVGNDPLLASRRVQLATLATRHALPVIYYEREFAEVGGLMSYGPSLLDLYRFVGVYVGRVLKGEKPADLPVMQPTKFELVINLQTARALGIAVPPTLLATADEVIE